jgi:hypothetical protein
MIVADYIEHLVEMQKQITNLKTVLGGGGDATRGRRRGRAGRLRRTNYGGHSRRPSTARLPPVCRFNVRRFLCFSRSMCKLNQRENGGLLALLRPHRQVPALPGQVEAASSTGLESSV